MYYTLDNLPTEFTSSDNLTTKVKHEGYIISIMRRVIELFGENNGIIYLKIKIRLKENHPLKRGMNRNLLRLFISLLEDQSEKRIPLFLEGDELIFDYFETDFETEETLKDFLQRFIQKLDSVIEDHITELAGWSDKIMCAKVIADSMTQKQIQELQIYLDQRLEKI